MKDWVLAVMLAIAIVGVLFVVPIVVVVVSALLGPLIGLAVITIVAWFCIQVLREGENDEDEQGP